MAPYRRRRRRWGYRRRWRWPRGPYKRIWRPYRSRRQRRRRKVRHKKRRKRVVTLWEPDSKQKCVIRGQTIGLMATGFNVVNRLYTTIWTDYDMQVYPSGGGVNMHIFSLKFCYQEHRMFRNCWTHTNDGYDLAQYFGTKIYLQPHKTADYIFWWDSDLDGIKPEDYWRLHPMMLLCTKNCIFVRNQTAGGNHRTKKVLIKPPANQTSVWKFQDEWYNIPLFAWGMTFINWYEPFLRQSPGFIPYVALPRDQTYVWKDGTYKSLTSAAFNTVYSPLVDPGTGNEISVLYSGATSAPSADWSGKFRVVPKTSNLPYWFTCFGQNPSYDFNIKRAKDEGNSGWVPWVRFYWTNWEQTTIQIQPDPKPQRYEFVTLSTTMANMARSGYFVLSSTANERLNVPFMYSSYWRWGGTMLKKNPIVAIHPQTNQVSVKNPNTIRESLIYPRDTRDGLLTARALQRFLQPSRISDERRPLPFEEQPPRYPDSEEYDETGDEAEESEEESEKESDSQTAIRRLGKRIQRERAFRHGLNKFLKSLLSKQQ
nr:ORF1 [Torque teno felis virus]